MMAGEFERALPSVIAAVSRQYALSTPAKGDQLQRCMVLIGDEDPVAPARILDAGARRARLSAHARAPARRHRRPLSARRADGHPEWTLRNVADLTAWIGSHAARLVGGHAGAHRGGFDDHRLAPRFDLPTAP